MWSILVFPCQASDIVLAAQPDTVSTVSYVFSNLKRYANLTEKSIDFLLFQLQLYTFKCKVHIIYVSYYI